MIFVAAACGPLPQRAALPSEPPAPDRTPAPTLPPTPTPLTVPTGAAAISRGSDLFFMTGCFSCHGQAGEGYIGPQIARTSLPIGAVVAQVRFPMTPKMTAFSRRQLSDEEIAYIYAFLQSLGSR